MDFLKDIRLRARKNPKRIVFPEGAEHRIIESVKLILSQKIAQITLLGDREEIIRGLGGESLLKKEDISIIEPRTSERAEEYAALFYKLYKDRGITEKDAGEEIRNPLYFAAMMTRCGEVDGFVAGAETTTGNVARAAIRCLGMERSIGIASGAFLMVVPESRYGYQGALLFADCALVPEPTREQLAEIAIDSAHLMRRLMAVEPYVAMLSYSTKTSASGPLVDKVKKAMDLVREKAPHLKVDGPLQSDSALELYVAHLKVPESLVGGRANVLIFPDLNSANIAYKLVQRLAKARAIGPILQGFKKSCSDLSRGCTSQDIVDATAITVVRAQQHEDKYK